jgi:hypothetical protein
VRRGAVLLLAVVVAACSGSAGGAGPEPVPCEPDLAAPRGFEPLEPFEEEYPDHVGLRLGFRHADGRELHFFSGIPGEFGEGLPAAGPVELTRGRTGFLVGREEVWVLVWREGGVCDPRALLANGYSREAFLDMLEETGLGPAPGSPEPTASGS